jgi:hypothetical protein
MGLKHFLLSSVVALLPISPVLAQNTAPPTGDVSGARVTATGGTTGATLANTVPLSVLHFGQFTCDGQPHTYNAVTLQAAANAGQKIILPAGRCRLNATVHLVSGTELIGQGRPIQYQFTPTTGTTLDFVDVPSATDGLDSGGVTIQTARIADMQIERATGAGININCVYCTIERVSSAYNGGNGVTLTNTYLTTIDQLFTELNGGAGFVETSGSTNCLVSAACYTTTHISNSEADHNTGNGWDIQNQDTTTFYNTGSDHNGGYGYKAKWSLVSFVGADSESNAMSGYYLYQSRGHFSSSKGAANNTSATSGEANFLLADTGSFVQIDSSLDFAASTPNSLNAINTSNIYQNMNNTWVAAQAADGTSFAGNIAGVLKFKPTSEITFNPAASSATAYGLYGDSANTILNVETGGTLSFRVHNVNKATLDGSGNFAATGTGTVVNTLQINGAAASDRLLKFSSSGVARFGWDVNTTAESGSNVGSDLVLVRYSDAGSVIDTPMTVTRSTGLMTLGDGLTVNGNLTVTGTSGHTGTATFGVSSGGTGTGVVVNNGLQANGITSTGSGVVTVGSGGNNHIVLTPTSTGTGPSITSTGTDGLRILTGGSTLAMNEPWSQTASPAWSGATTPNGVLLTQSYTGSSSSTMNLNVSQVTDTLDGSGPGSMAGWYFLHNYGGGTTKGGRRAVDIALVQQGGAATDSGVDNFYTALRAQAFGRASPPGSSSTNPLGRVFGFNAYGEIQSGFTAPNYYQIAGGEIDVGIIGTGSSAAIRTGLTIADLGGIASGFWGDNMLWLYGGGVGFRNGIMFGDMQPWPLDASTGTMFGAKMAGGSNGSSPFTTKWGVDLVQVKFPSTGNPYDGGVLRSNGISIDGAGTIQQGSCYLSSGSSGGAIDCKGSFGTSAAIAAAGTGYKASAVEVFTTAYGGLWAVTINGSGVPSSIVQLSAPAYPSTTPPSNPVATINQRPDDSGTGLTLNITWNTTATGLSLQPSGGNIEMAAASQFISIGSAVGRKNAANNTVATWVGNAAGGLMIYYDQYGRVNSYLNSAHGMAFAAAAQTFDNSGVMMGYAAYVESKVGTSGAAWGSYTHGAKYGTGSVLGHEIDVANVGTLVKAKPYQMGLAGVTADIWLGAGGETAQQSSPISITNTAAAVGILANGTATNPAFFDKGIVIGANAIAGDDGSTGTAIAMQMAKGHEIQWVYDTTETRGAFIRSDATASGTGIIFGNSTINFARQSNESTPVLSIANAVTGQVNGFQIDGSATNTGVDIQAIGTDANIPIAIQPKGIAGWFALNIRDGSTTGGNGRGNKAVDLQMSRDAASQVASGNYSFAAGRANTASGDRAVGIGESNNITGTHSVGIGYASADRGKYGVEHFASGFFSNAGDAQDFKADLRVQTTDATATRITTDGAAAGAANSLTLPSSGSDRCSGQVLARNTSTGATASWSINWVIKTTGTVGSTALVGSPTITQDFADTGTTSWAVAITADTTNGASALAVTGAASTTIRWVGRVVCVETTS